MRFAKQGGTAVIIVGHVTKDGAIAGPKLLEHLVDTVLYFDADAGSRYRMLRATKNRFGPVNELGFFAMTDAGLREVRNPSAIFLSRNPQPVPGSLVMVARDGGRPLLIEVQALIDATRFSAPRRVAQGVDANRLSMLLAVMSRHSRLSPAEHDVYVNLVGWIDHHGNRHRPAAGAGARLRACKAPRSMRRWWPSANSDSPVKCGRCPMARNG